MVAVVEVIIWYWIIVTVMNDNNNDDNDDNGDDIQSSWLWYEESREGVREREEDD